MIRKQIKSKPVTMSPELPRKLWLAGLGVVSIAQKQSQAVADKLVSEGEDLQIKAKRLAKQYKTDAKKLGDSLKKQATKAIKPYQNRVLSGVNNAQDAIGSRINGVLGKFGVPSKNDIDELLDRVSELNQQVKASAKKASRNARA